MGSHYARGCQRKRPVQLRYGTLRGAFPARHVPMPDLATFDVSGPTLVSCRLMEEKLLTANEAGSLPLWFLTESELPRWLNLQPAPVASWVRAHAFQAERHRALAYPNSDGSVGGAIVGLGSLQSVGELKVWNAAGLSDRLPAYSYHVAN